MDTLNEEIEGSFIGGAQAAVPGASPYHPTDLGEKIYDINTVVFNYTNFPTKRSETRNDMVHSLIKMLTKANRDLTYYISDLKQSKCIEPFCLTSKQDFYLQGSRYVPCMGMFCSQRGNISFPTWEYVVPLMGIIARHLMVTYVEKKYICFATFLPLKASNRQSITN